MPRLKVKCICFGKDKPTLIQELKKFEEEAGEFEKAVLSNDITNMLEEYHDVIMTMNNALQLAGISTSLIAESQAEHFEKLKERGWVLSDRKR